MGFIEDLIAKGRVCEWFALCDRPATVLVPHPVLGQVPTCDRCADRVARLRG